jgi:death-on-curing protein
MTSYLTLSQVLHLHQQIIKQSGGTPGILDYARLASALAQPRMTFDGKDLYPSVTEKAATLGFSLIQNHPFVDGNKRIGHAAMEVFLIMNGYEIKAHVDVQEKMILKIASGQNDRSSLEKWLKSHIVKVN